MMMMMMMTFGSLLSQSRLSSVTFMRPTQGKLSAIAILYLSHSLTSMQNFMEIVPKKPPIAGVKRKRGIAIYFRFGISSPGEFVG